MNPVEAKSKTGKYCLRLKAEKIVFLHAHHSLKLYRTIITFLNGFKFSESQVDYQVIK